MVILTFRHSAGTTWRGSSWNVTHTSLARRSEEVSDTLPSAFSRPIRPRNVSRKRDLSKVSLSLRPNSRSSATGDAYDLPTRRNISFAAIYYRRRLNARYRNRAALPDQIDNWRGQVCL